MLMAAVMPRLLKLPVGGCDSSFTNRFGSELFAEPGQCSSGVIL